MSRLFRSARSMITHTPSMYARGFHSSRIARDHFLNATKDAFKKRALDTESSKLLLVDFTATWCQPCKVLGPLLQRLTGPETLYDLMTVDVDEHQDLAAEYKVSAVPFVVAFRNGKPVNKFVGMLPEAKIKEWLGKLQPEI